MSDQTKKIGIMGGSFDPIHIGHLVMAQDALEQMALDEVCFVPAAWSPMKAHNPVASEQDRLAMVKSALEPFPHFYWDDFEIQSGGVSYTIESVEWYLKKWPEHKLYWIIGADQLQQISEWHRIDELVEMIDFISVERPGFADADPVLPSNIKVTSISAHLLEISSTEIRERVKRSAPIDFFVPADVKAYIDFNRIYS